MKNIDNLLTLPSMIVGFPGTTVPDNLQTAIQAQSIGGLILFRGNFGEDRRPLTTQLRDLNERYGILIAIDQEGGRVQRLTAAHGLSDYPSARDVAATMSVDSAYELYRRMARELVNEGINLNFGPVVDLDVDPNCPIIGHYGRSYGRDPQRVTDYAAAFIAAHRDTGVLTCVKHFPGHGSARTDSHLGFTDITETWQPDELEPYRQLQRRGLIDMVMVGHLFHRGIDPLFPATLSPIHLRVLREEIGFTGPVVTDDLVMKAISDHYPPGEVIRRATDAGCNFLIWRDAQAMTVDSSRKISID